jgi:hypothetical protein
MSTAAEAPVVCRCGERVSAWERVTIAFRIVCWKLVLATGTALARVYIPPWLWEYVMPAIEPLTAL